MPRLYAGFNVIVDAGATLTLTRAITGKHSTLAEVIWHRFRPNATTTFSAWFHGDTPTPSQLAIGNDFITPQTTFPAGIKSQAREVLAICRPIPTWAKGLAISINNSAGLSAQETEVVYVLLP